jgi:hypothetical protein
MFAMTVSYFRPTRVFSKTSRPEASTLMLIASRSASTIPRAMPSSTSDPLLIRPTSGKPRDLA